MKAKGEFYSTGEVAKILSVSSITVKRWAEKKQIESIRTPGGRYLIPENEIKRLLGKKESTMRITVTFPTDFGEKLKTEIKKKYGKNTKIEEGLIKISKLWLAKKRKGA